MVRCVLNSVSVWWLTLNLSRALFSHQNDHGQVGVVGRVQEYHHKQHEFKTAKVRMVEFERRGFDSHGATEFLHCISNNLSHPKSMKFDKCDRDNLNVLASKFQADTSRNAYFRVTTIISV